MPKIGRQEATSKIVKKPSGKVNSAECCCPGGVGCVTGIGYGVRGAGTPLHTMGATYKIVVSGVAACTSCDEIPADTTTATETHCFGFGHSSADRSRKALTTSPINRTYYVSELASIPAAKNGWGGNFFGSVVQFYTDTACADAWNPDLDFGVGGTPDFFHLFLDTVWLDDPTTPADERDSNDYVQFDFQINGNDFFRTRVDPFQASVPHTCEFFPESISPDYVPEALWLADGDEFAVGDPVTLNNLNTDCELSRAYDYEGDTHTRYWHHLGQDGTVTITPCPPCAIPCGHLPCATVSLSGTQCDGGGFFNYEFWSGDYQFLEFRENWTGGQTDGIDPVIVTNDPQGQPAGCHWVWRKQIEVEDGEGNTLAGFLDLTVWYDGQDWRLRMDWGGATPVYEGKVPYTFYLAASPGAGFGCTQGTLDGTFELITRKNGSSTSPYRDDCEATITFSEDCGLCPADDDCSTCCGEYEWGFIFSSELLAQVDVTCEWEDTQGNLLYHDGSIWIYEGALPGEAGAFRYEAACDGACPPTERTDWTRTIGNPSFFPTNPTTLITDECPP